MDAMTHPLVRELLAMLPPPDAPFSRERRRQWVEAANAVLTLVYGNDEDDDAGRAYEDVTPDVVDSSETPQPWPDDARHIADPYNGADPAHGSARNGAGAWASNGHEIVGRHRRRDLGLL